VVLAAGGEAGLLTAGCGPGADVNVAARLQRAYAGELRLESTTKLPLPDGTEDLCGLGFDEAVFFHLAVDLLNFPIQLR
jgi:hypothetical protein